MKAKTLKTAATSTGEAVDFNLEACTWELAARYSDTDLNYDVNSLVSADQVHGGDQKIISAGLNFYPNYNVKFMFDWQNVDIGRPW